MEKENTVKEQNLADMSEDVSNDVFNENMHDSEIQDEGQSYQGDKQKKGFYDYATSGFLKIFTRRLLYCVLLSTFILFLVIWRSGKYKGMVLDVEEIQQSISDIKNKEIFVSSKLVEYKNQDLIENEIKNKNLNLVISDEAPYLIEDENK